MQSKFVLVMSALLGIFSVTSDSHAQQAVWTAHGPGGNEPTDNGSARSRPIAFDAAGNSYVAGTVWNGLNDDAQLVRYDSNGAVVWQRRYNGIANDKDEVAGVVVDAAGNVLVAGQSRVFGGLSGALRRIFILKFDTAGNQLWVVRSGSGSDDLGVVDLAVNASNQVLLLANNGVLNSSNALLLKFSAAGEMVWRRDYLNTELPQGRSSGVAFALDAGGNSLICANRGGSLWHLDGDARFAVIKYDDAGSLLWERRSAAVARCAGLALDASGRSIVTGTVGTAWSTTQYDEQGTQNWQATVARPNAGGNAELPSVAAASDGGGLVSLPTSAQGSPRIRYGAMGNVLWTQTVASTIERQQIVLDAAGGHFMVTRSDNSVQPVAMTFSRHDSGGNLVWSHAVPNSESPWLGTVARTPAGGVAGIGIEEKAGRDDRFVRVYRADGVLNWSASGVPTAGGAQRMSSPGYGVPAHPGTMIRDAISGYLISSLVPSGDYWTCTIDRHGADGRWLSNIIESSPGYSCRGLNFAADSGGNVYVVAARSQALDPSGLNWRNWQALTKYDRFGVPQWERTLCDCAPGSSDTPAELAVDGGGHPILLLRQDSGNSLMRYDSNGNRLWELSPEFAVGDIYYPYGLLVDSSSNILLGGYVYGGPTGNSRVVVKYASSGIRAWGTGYGEVVGWNFTETARTLVFDGSLIVTGYRSMSGPTGSATDVVVRRFDAAGSPAWTRYWNGPGNGFDYATALAADSSGNVIVAGITELGPGAWAMAAIKYSASGVEQWSRHQNAYKDSRTVSQAVVVDAADNVYVTGDTASADPSNPFLDGPGDFFTVKFDPLGSLQWTHRYNGSRSADDEIRAMVAADGGGVVIAGTEDLDTGSDRTVLIKLVDGPRPDAIFEHGFDTPMAATPIGRLSH